MSGPLDYLAEFDRSVPGFGDLYDELPLWSAPFGLMLLERVPMRAGQTVLDVGAGTGFMSLELAQRCGPTSTVIAVDPWTVAMERLRSKRDRLGIGNLRLVERDVAQIDLEDDSIDLVVSNLGINNFENPEAVLRTCLRAMKPGAPLFLTTNLSGHMQEFYEVFERTLVALDLHDRLPALRNDVTRRGTVESVSRLLERCGFAPVTATTGSFRLRYADGSSFLRHILIRIGFVSTWKTLVLESDAVRVFSALEANLNALAAERGELALTVPMGCFEARKPGQP